MNDLNPMTCTQIFVSGKNKGQQCSLPIVCIKNNLCVRHNNIRLAQNYKKYGNYGNPDQAELWVKWIMDVDKSIDKSINNSGENNNEKSGENNNQK